MSKKRALVSVSNKEGVVEFAEQLAELDYEIVSTGGTAKTLRDNGVTVTYISDVTDFPEILEGRVKTLHPKVHGGILAKRNEEHLAQLKENEITPIDLVAVNLYPFRETIAKEGVTLDEAIENIDIGGPAMVRASAKNYAAVTIIVNPTNYQTVIDELKDKGNVSPETRFNLAKEAFTHTAGYDKAIAEYLTSVCADGETSSCNQQPEFAEQLNLQGVKKQDLRYGENPHQKAAFYQMSKGSNVANATQLQGKALSFNNLMDANAALELVKEYDHPAAVVIKHTNPCGASEADDLTTAYKQAYEADPVSSFGGIVACNRPVTEAVATEMSKIFLEVVIAPEFTPEAIAVLEKKENLRLLAIGSFEQDEKQLDVKAVAGGILVQEADKEMVTSQELKVVTETKPDEKMLRELLFAWKTVKHVKSNAIVVAKGGTTLGVGAGQMNRVGSVKISLEQAGEKAQGAILASDAFFPFADSVEEAGKAGIKAIIQPGGSKRDEESIAKANELGIIMVFTGQRHFKH
ncbi:phosphoribosylaminoimidazolecarboxamide formyltransferase/IMP cyclohydrolase [Desulfitispora alkaliphila]|uniref:bifunctional phosphoribosylaminoimidazolecarboxamide formyltransferase/IMP cyclohydrolase n=1 Tax=Desulfitispora alkaliphila TaxID=622674 RepID=UPI003D1BDAD4